VVTDFDTGALVEWSTQYAYGADESHWKNEDSKYSDEDGKLTSFEPYGFTGKEEDKEVGLHYFGARYYSAYLGRWLNPDPPVVHSGGVTNLYNYGANSPYIYVDPDGNFALTSLLVGLGKYAIEKNNPKGSVIYGSIIGQLLGGPIGGAVGAGITTSVWAKKQGASTKEALYYGVSWMESISSNVMQTATAPYWGPILLIFDGLAPMGKAWGNVESAKWQGMSMDYGTYSGSSNFYTGGSLNAGQTRSMMEEGNFLNMKREQARVRSREMVGWEPGTQGGLTAEQKQAMAGQVSCTETEGCPSNINVRSAGNWDAQQWLKEELPRFKKWANQQMQAARNAGDNLGTVEALQDMIRHAEWITENYTKIQEIGGNIGSVVPTPAGADDRGYFRRAYNTFRVNYNNAVEALGSASYLNIHNELGAELIAPFSKVYDAVGSMPNANATKFLSTVNSAYRDAGYADHFQQPLVKSNPGQWGWKWYKPIDVNRI
jgi:RHS repeat-associated protein